MTSHIDLKVDQLLFRIKAIEQPKRYFIIFVCGSLAIHAAFFLFLIDSEIVHPHKREIEPISVELIRSLSLAANESGNEPNQILPSGNANSAEPIKSKSKQANDLEKTKVLDSSPLEKRAIINQKEQRDQLNSPEKPSGISPLAPLGSHPSSETQEFSGLKSKPGPKHEEPHHGGKEAAKSGKPAKNGSKTNSKSVTNNTASLTAGERGVSGVNPQEKMASLAFAEGVKRQPTSWDQEKPKVPLPTIPFDPQVFRAVAVPLPSPEGDEPVSYKEIVFGLLERAKHYPDTALARGAKGIAVVEFSLDSAGSVVRRSLLRSSGEPDLDAESLELLDRASPFPPPPLGAQHSFSAEIGFGIAGE